MEPDGGAGLPVLTLVPTEEPPPKRRKDRASDVSRAFNPTDAENLTLRTVLNRQADLHAGYGWTAAHGKPKVFRISGGTCRVALACLRSGWTAGRLVEGLRAICWREAHAEGKRATGQFATLHGMLGGGRELQTDKADKLERAIAAYEDAGCPEPAPVGSRAVAQRKPIPYSAIAASLEE